jgi:hypothetical protein
MPPETERRTASSCEWGVKGVFTSGMRLEDIVLAVAKALR